MLNVALKKCMDNVRVSPEPTLCNSIMAGRQVLLNYSLENRPQSFIQGGTHEARRLR
jgi:hypothetical protein